MMIPEAAAGRWSPSLHAMVRAQQRSIPRFAWHSILDWGRVVPAPGGALRLSLDRATLAELEAELGPEAFRRVERKLRAYAVVGRDGTVITVAWPRRRKDR